MDSFLTPLNYLNSIYTDAMLPSLYKAAAPRIVTHFDWYMMRSVWLCVSRACQLVLFLHALCVDFYWLWFELNVIKWCFCLCCEFISSERFKNGIHTKIGGLSLIFRCDVTKEHTEKSSNRTKATQHCCSSSINNKNNAQTLNECSTHSDKFH